MVTKDLGMVTAYAYAVAGGYTGTEAEFTQLMADLAVVVDDLDNFSVNVTTLPAGSSATASYSDGVLSLGIPKGDKGDKGNTGETGAPAGFGTVSATVDANIGTPSVEVTASGADTAKNFAFAFHNLKGQKGDKGDTGEVSEAELAEALEDFAENGTVANAEQLTTKIRANDQTPYLFRTSGGSVDIGDREYINGIVGGTVAWNQLIPIGTDKSKTQNGVTFTDNRDGSYTVQTTAEGASADAYITIASETTSRGGHVTLLMGAPTGSSYEGYRMWDAWGGAGNEYGNGSTGKFVSGGQFEIRISVGSGTIITTPVKFKPQLFDITQMFGGAVANYFYDTLRLTSGASKAWFRKFFSKPIYAYNAGELMSVQASSHDMVGFNQFDGEVDLGGCWTETGTYQVIGGGYMGSPNKIKCLPNTTYCFTASNITAQAFLYYAAFDANGNYISCPYGTAIPADTKYGTFTTPSDCYFIGWYLWRSTAFTNAEAEGICVNLSWDGERDGEYEEYVKHSYQLDSSLTLRGIPKLDSSNNLYYDGDTYESDGTVTRKYGVVDLGTLTWSKISTTGDHWRFYATYDDAKAAANTVTGNLMCEKYEATTALESYGGQRGVAVQPNGTHTVLMVVDENYSDQTAFKTAMSGVYLVYELATPTTESADPYTSPQIVNDFGTEEWVFDSDVFPMPVGNNTDYPIDLKAKVEMAPNSPDGDGDYIVRQTNGTNEYVAFANNATIQNILARLEALEG